MYVVICVSVEEAIDSTLTNLDLGVNRLELDRLASDDATVLLRNILFAAYDHSRGALSLRHGNLAANV